MPKSQERLTVAVTGPTGTFGYGLVPLLQSEQRVQRIVGIARRPFDPSEIGWTKMEYRQGDVRDPDALEDAFRGADVVVHLAFMITGNASRETIRAINVEGTLNAFRAAAAAGAKRFVYASSVAAYGFHTHNPVGMTAEWPGRAEGRGGAGGAGRRGFPPRRRRRKRSGCGGPGRPRGGRSSCPCCPRRSSS